MFVLYNFSAMRRKVSRGVQTRITKDVKIKTCYSPPSPFLSCRARCMDAFSIMPPSNVDHALPCHQNQPRLLIQLRTVQVNPLSTTDLRLAYPEIQPPGVGRRNRLNLSSLLNGLEDYIHSQRTNQSRFYTAVQHKYASLP